MNGSRSRFMAHHFFGSSQNRPLHPTLDATFPLPGGKVNYAGLSLEEVIKGHVLLDFQLELGGDDALDPGLLAFDHLGEEGFC
jgi:hypothetical protein